MKKLYMVFDGDSFIVCFSNKQFTDKFVKGYIHHSTTHYGVMSDDEIKKIKEAVTIRVTEMESREPAKLTMLYGEPIYKYHAYIVFEGNKLIKCFPTHDMASGFIKGAFGSLEGITIKEEQIDPHIECT